MHVAFWSPAWPLEKFQNGIITYVHSVKSELERRGHRVSVFAGKVHESGIQPGVFEVRRSRKDRIMSRLLGRSREQIVSNFSSAIANAILQEHRRNPIDVVEMEESFGWCADVQERTSLPTVVKLHGPAFLTLTEHERTAPFGREKIEREGRALTRCSTIIAPSEITLRRTVEQYGITDKATRVIPNPIAEPAEMPLWSLDTCERNTILFVGRFDLVKGADVVLEAFAAVLETLPDAKLIFVGPDTGWSTPDGERVHFASYCSSRLPLEARERIVFCGRMAHEDIATLRTQSMATVVASRWETQGYTLLEAMLQGCPVVSTDAGACPESVFHGRTGFLAHSEDTEDFAEQLRFVLQHTEHAAKIGMAARKHVVQRHSPSAVVDTLLECYETEIVNRRRLSPGP